MARIEPGCSLRVGLFLALAFAAPSLAAQTSPPLLQPNPQTRALWHLDEGQGHMASDAGPAGQDALLENGVAWIPTPWGNGLAFTGPGQSLTISDPGGGLEPTGPFTLEAWIRLDSLASASNPVLSREAAQGGSAYELRFMAFPAGWAFKFLDSTGAPQVLFGRSSLKAREWHHVAVTWDGKALRLFQDTLLLSTLPASGFLGASLCHPLRVGPGEHGTWFQGALDELHLARAALPWSFFRAGQTSYGLGKPGTFGVIPTLRQSGGPPATATKGLVMDLDRGFPFLPGLLFLSPAPAQLPVDGGWILVSPFSMATLPLVFDGGIAGIPGTGRARVALPHLGPAFLGQVLCCQALLADPGASSAFSLTAGLALWFPY